MSKRVGTYEGWAEYVSRHPGAIPEGCYFIDPRQPEHTANQFLDWYGKQKSEQREPLTRRGTRASIYNFLDTAAWWKTSIRGPVKGGSRDHLILPFCPSARDINRIALALRQAF